MLFWNQSTSANPHYLTSANPYYLGIQHRIMSSFPIDKVNRLRVSVGKDMMTSW